MKNVTFVLLLVVCFAAAVTATATAEVRTQVVEYQEGATTLEGFFAFDDSFEGRRPGILVVHEWTGLGVYVKNRCTQLAKMGFAAFAADIYGKGIRPEPGKAAAKEASRFKGDRPLLRRRALAGLSQLQSQSQVDSKMVAAIGYCFGGTTVLELARSGAGVKGVVSFHGGLETPLPVASGSILAKVLVLHGADDPHVPLAEVQAFQQEMRVGGVDWQMVSYGRAVHSFTNREAGADPSKGAAYNPSADARSWEAMKIFFQELFPGFRPN